MLTAEVLALTTSVEMHVAASTPPTRVLSCATSLIGFLSLTGPDRKRTPHRSSTEDLPPLALELFRRHEAAGDQIRELGHLRDRVDE